MNQRNYEREAWKSAVSAQVFQLIHTGEADYTQNIASKLGTKPQTISNYVKGLREAGFIKRKEEKSGRKVRYETQLTFLVDRFYDELDKNLQRDYQDSKVQYDIEEEGGVELPEELQNKKEVIKEFHNHEEKIKEFSESFIENYITSLNLRSGQSLRDLFFFEFSYSLLFIYYRHLERQYDIEEKKLEWLNPLMNALIRARSTGYSYSILKQTLEEFE